jgi:hypothetical protein
VILRGIRLLRKEGPSPVWEGKHESETQEATKTVDQKTPGNIRLWRSEKGWVQQGTTKEPRLGFDFSSLGTLTAELQILSLSAVHPPCPSDTCLIFTAEMKMRILITATISNAKHCSALFICT